MPGTVRPGLGGEAEAGVEGGVADEDGAGEAAGAEGVEGGGRGRRR